MIVEYNRAKTMEDALALLARAEPLTVPLGGGSALNCSSPISIAVVDLQALGLNFIIQQGSDLVLGATLTLQGLLDNPALSDTSCPGLGPVLRKAISHEATYNLRRVATVAGTLMAADGRSPFTTAMLALDASLDLQYGDERQRFSQTIYLGDLLPVRSEKLCGGLITQVTIPLNVHLAYEYIARSPADRPIVCAAVAAWPSGRTRVALGGYGIAPVLACDGTDADGAELAASNAYRQSGDEWASAEYRQEMAALLTRRCLQQLASYSPATNH